MLTKNPGNFLYPTSQYSAAGQTDTNKYYHSTYKANRYIKPQFVLHQIS